MLHSPVAIECYDRSVLLLKNNCSNSGVIACAASEKAVGRHYASIFGRDAAICGLGMIASGNSELISSAKKSIITLGRYQAPNGQIPKYVKPEDHEVDFWYYGCIDATLWWLLAIDFYDSHVPGQPLSNSLSTEIRLAIHWLLCQEHQGLFLLQQNEASDWADIMPRSGFVLYSNALWYLVKKQYRLPHAERTKQYARHLFLPFDAPLPENRRARVLSHYIRKIARQRDFFLSFVNFASCGTEIDVFGNVLACLFGLVSPSRAGRIVSEFMELGVHRPYPLRVVHRPIRENSPLWRTYMGRHRQNFPYQYHNGGIWPFTAGFWVLLLLKLRRREEAVAALNRFAEANRAGNWAFNEWLHGKTGQPMGMNGQSWNAAMFMLASHALSDGLRIF